MGAGRPLIKIEALRKSFGDFTLRIDSLEIREREFFTLLGPDGSGKTSLMRILGGLLLPDEGTVLVDGRRAHLQRMNDRIVRNLFEDLCVFPNRTVEEQLKLAVASSGSKAIKDCSNVVSWIGLLELRGKEQTLPDGLTPRERQRLALGRALISEPRLVLLDVPRRGFENDLRVDLWHWIGRLSHHVPSTFVVATHDADVALTRSKRIAVLDGGDCVQIGMPRQIYLRPATETVERLVAGANILEWNGNRYAILPEDIEIGNRPLSHRDFQDQAVVVYSGNNGNQTEYALAWREELLLVRSASGKAPPIKRKSRAYFGWDTPNLVLLVRRIGLGMVASGQRGHDCFCGWDRLAQKGESTRPRLKQPDPG